MSNLAVITARGGSKRITRKNVRSFCGKPIIAYSIEAALKSGLFDEVMVSTEDEEIADMAMKFNAKVPFYRSVETSNDFATTMDVLKEVVKCYRELGKIFDYMCCLYPTAPFITAKKLIAGYETLLSNDVDMVTPVVKFNYPPQRGFTMDEEGYLKYCYPEYVNSRSQDLEPIYHDVGQFYWYNVKECFGDSKKELKMGTIILPENEVQDIDNESDWILAEMKYSLLKELQ